MFLWRKLTILEGNYFLLEKRVNIIKKEDRSEQLSKNLEKSDAIMKEVFKNNIKRGNCDNNDTVCNIPKNTDEEDFTDQITREFTCPLDQSKCPSDNKVILTGPTQKLTKSYSWTNVAIPTAFAK